MTNKKYYWLKLKDDFFERPEIKLIENIENGEKYLIFLLKLKLKSLKSDGYLRVNDHIPYDDKSLSIFTGTDIDVVRSAIKVFLEFRLLEVMEDKTIYMSCISEMIGTETDAAKRTRDHRERKKLLHCNKMKQKCNTEIEIELDKETDIEIEKELEIHTEKDKTNLNQFANSSPMIVEKPLFAFDLINSFMNGWNSLGLGKIPKIKILTPKRINKLKTRMKNDPDFVEHFKMSLLKIPESDFLMGRSSSWQVTFDWLIENDTNYIKVCEGNYDGKSKKDLTNAQILGLE